MQISNRFLHLICLVVIFSALACPLFFASPASANPDRLAWSIIDTPSKAGNVIAPGTVPHPGSEVNFIAVGADDLTIYAVDTSNTDPAGRCSLYKSIDNGVTWTDNPGVQLFNKMTPDEQPNFRIWNIATAPDNSGIVAVVTSSDTDKPRQVYISTDGGSNWSRPDLILPGLENISCIDISATYGINQHDIAIGTRTIPAAPDGQVYTLRLNNSTSETWKPQSISTDGWTTSDVIALKFSPNYNADFGLAAVISDATDTFLDQGRRDTGGNLTVWKTLTIGANLVELSLVPGQSPKSDEIISACIQLPSDFNSSTPSSQRYYISYDDNRITSQSGIYRVDYNVAFRIFQSSALLPASPAVRISSIAYYGSVASGTLLAGQVEANNFDPGSPSLRYGDLWKTTDPTTITPPPAWTKAAKPPTGGATPASTSSPARYLANMQVVWNPSGNRVYCGTSSANLVGDDSIDPFHLLSSWPNGYKNRVNNDESAFSVSPYSTIYQQRMEYVKKELDVNYGNIWNQTGLIDTKINKLSDVAALEVPSTSAQDYNVVYLSTKNDINRFNSVWRSVPDINGIYTWERTSAIPNIADASLIIRVNSGNSYMPGLARSHALVAAEQGSIDSVKYSADEGQAWTRLNPGISVVDMAMESDSEIFIADDISVRKGTNIESNWSWSAPVSTGLFDAHNIAVLPSNATSSINNKKADEWVLVGEEIQGQGRVAYCDFSGNYPRPGGSPRFELTPPIPLIGEVHVCMNDLFAQNRMIFAGVADSGGITGSVYRWVVGQGEPVWTELQPNNSAFFGLVMNRDVLYGAWNNASAAFQPPGVDRTLHATQAVPPPPEWDSLTFGLPRSPAPIALFKKEPSALKLSVGDYIDLWAIDAQNYVPFDPDNPLNPRQGLLWAYSDTLARRGPFPSSPAAGSIAPFDPKTGRAAEINFQWFQLQDAGLYELVAAKDEQFTKIVLQIVANVTTPPYIKPYNQNAPSWILPPGNMLESGHEYFWKIRASGSIQRALEIQKVYELERTLIEQGIPESERAAIIKTALENIQGDLIHSPWSATMYFTVIRGLPVETNYYGPILLSPADSCGCTCNSTTNFSWAPYSNTNKYLFELSDRQDMALPLVSTEVPNTAYQYAGNLKCGKNYYWRVRAVSSFPSDWSATFTFRTQPAAQASTPNDIATVSRQAPVPTIIVIGMVIVGALLDICMLMLLIRTRRE